MTRNSKKYRQDKKILLTVAALILCAVVCRLFSRFDVVDDALNYLCSLLRSIIYMGIIITWGVSVRRRVLNRSVPQISDGNSGAAAVLVRYKNL